MVPALMFVIYTCPVTGGLYTIHKAWDYCSIIVWWAVQSLKTVIDDGSHAFFIYGKTYRRGQEGIKYN